MMSKYLHIINRGKGNRTTRTRCSRHSHYDTVVDKLKGERKCKLKLHGLESTQDSKD